MSRLHEIFIGISNFTRIIHKTTVVKYQQYWTFLNERILKLSELLPRMGILESR